MHRGRPATQGGFITLRQEESLCALAKGEYSNESLFILEDRQQGSSCKVNQIKDLGQKPQAPPKDYDVSIRSEGQVCWQALS